MDEPIEETYFKWLYSKVASVPIPTPALTYWNLLRILHRTEFVWLVSGDDNRAADGIEVRKEFFNQLGQERDPTLMSLPCSVLEMMIAFARRAEFQTEIPVRDWFWVFLHNLQLSGCSDAEPDIEDFVMDVLDEFLWRTYQSNGEGGMFPLSNLSKNDQRKVEIWYQFCEYVVDRDIL
jgi:hypothetical protein